MQRICRDDYPKKQFLRSASSFWAMRNGFYFTAAGSELPIVWTVLLALQFMLGDGPYALRASHK